MRNRGLSSISRSLLTGAMLKFKKSTHGGDLVRKLSQQSNSEHTDRSSSKNNYLLPTAVLGTTVATLALLGEEKRQQFYKKLLAFYHALLESSTPKLLDIPGLPQNLGIVHGISTQKLGNVGFVTLNVGATAEELVANISQGAQEVHAFKEAKTHKPNGAKTPLLILNETAYATTTAPGLETRDGKPQFILSLTKDNIERFIQKNQFSEKSEFAALRDKCLRVTADGFVSNLSEFQNHQLYFSVNTADAAPAILFDAKAGVVGIMSCSWHNIAKAEFDELIQSMVRMGANPRDMHMGIGPGLGPQSFEFTASDARYFYEPNLIDKRDGRAFQGRPELKPYIKSHPTDAQKCLLDVPGMLTEIATLNGIPQLHIFSDASWDSMQNKLFYSARRTTPPHKRATEAQQRYAKAERGISFVHREAPEPTAAPREETPAVTAAPQLKG